MSDPIARDGLAPRFWERKPLNKMSQKEWEALCDGCGKCCLNKLEDEETEVVALTRVACRLLDHGTCRCKQYAVRTEKVPDCVDLTPAEVRNLPWLPSTCAYRLVAEGQELAWWHPLISGDPESVHQAGISVRGRVIAEGSEKDIEDRIVDWPR